MPPATVAAVPPAVPVSVSGAHLISQPPHIPHAPGVPVSVPGAMQAPYSGIAPTMMMQAPPGVAGIPGARVAQIQHHQSQQELNNKLNTFWHEQMEEVQCPSRGSRRS